MLPKMSSAFAGFQCAEVSGIPVFWLPDSRFKTFRCTLSARRPLDQRAAARSILPSLLLQGTTRDPDRMHLARRMQSLYGAMVAPHTVKMGESHMLRFALDCVAGDYLPDKPDQFGQGLAFLAEILAQPRLQGAGFPAAVFAREQVQAANDARALFDERGAYAFQQALASACAGEPIAIREDGGVEAIEALQAADPEQARLDFLSHGQMWVTAMGALPKEGFLQQVEAFLQALPQRHGQEVPEPEQRMPTQRRETVERVELQQSKLVLVFRLPPSQDPDLWAARRLFSSILGGGPHSRLFNEVREKKSLAYYAQCSMERHKALMFVQVGLDEKAAAAVEEEVGKQIQELQQGNFSAEELSTAKAGLLSALSSVGDSVAARMSFLDDHHVLGLDRTPEQLAKVYHDVSLAAVAASMEGMALDYSYLLAPTATEQPEGTKQQEGLA